MKGPVFLVALILARSVGGIQAFAIAEPFGYPSRPDTTYFGSSLLYQSSIRFSLDEEIIMPSFCKNSRIERGAEFNKVVIRRCLIAYIDHTQGPRSTFSL